MKIQSKKTLNDDIVSFVLCSNEIKARQNCRLGWLAGFTQDGPREKRVWRNIIH